jgi:hypothetical protein
MHFSQATGQRSHNRTIIPYWQAFEQGFTVGRRLRPKRPHHAKTTYAQGFAGLDGLGGENKDKPYRLQMLQVARGTLGSAVRAAYAGAQDYITGL